MDRTTLRARGAAVLLGVTLLAGRAAAGPSTVDSLAAQVAAEQKTVLELEARVGALLRAPKPIDPPGGPPQKTYLGGGGELPLLDEHKRLDARHLMLVELERGGVTEVEYDDGTQRTHYTPPWEKAGFVVAPVEVLLAIRAAATPPLRGVEIDMRVPTHARGVHYVTLTHEIEGPLLVTDIAAGNVLAEPPKEALSDGELRKRFGIGKLDGGLARWSPEERQSLERALAFLSDRELARLRGVELRRESRPRQPLPFKGACGITHIERLEHWIEIYDCAFQHDGIVFVGNPKSPERGSVRLILHELGHAVAVGPIQDFNRDLESLAERGHATATQFAAMRAAASPEEQVALDQAARPLPAVANRMQAVAKQLGQSHAAGPAVTAFSRLRGASSGITSYGRESPAEAFAEAFSLFHADPDALRRISLEVLEFFQRGEHLSSH